MHQSQSQMLSQLQLSQQIWLLQKPPELQELHPLMCLRLVLTLSLPQLLQQLLKVCAVAQYFY